MPATTTTDGYIKQKSVCVLQKALQSPITIIFIGGGLRLSLAATHQVLKLSQMTV